MARATQRMPFVVGRAVAILLVWLVSSAIATAGPLHRSWVEREMPAREGHAMAYDSARGRTVLFGGFTRGNVDLADTWEWDGTTWTQKHPATSPPARQQHAMVYDGDRGRTLLFGGDGGLANLSDTWEWDGTAWTSRVGL